MSFGYMNAVELR